MKKRMKQFFGGLCIALLMAGSGALFISPAVQANVPGEGSWENVCCGSACSPGDFCTGTGEYSCCK